MTSLIVPSDPRRQFSLATLAVANAVLGRPTLDQVERVGEDRYVLAQAPGTSVLTSTAKR